MKGRSAKLAREEQAMRRNLGIKGKRPPQKMLNALVWA
jgi:hypothetical protein